MLLSTKGLEYICHGLFACAPNTDFFFVKRVFHYMMQVQGIREIFWSGSPLFYA